MHFSFEIENVNTLSQWFLCLLRWFWRFGRAFKTTCNPSARQPAKQTNKRISHYMKSHWRFNVHVRTTATFPYTLSHNIGNMCKEGHTSSPREAIEHTNSDDENFSLDNLYFFFCCSLPFEKWFLEKFQLLAHSIGLEIILICDRFEIVSPGFCTTLSLLLRMWHDGYTMNAL